MRSVRSKLSAAFIGIALLTTVLTAIFASYTARTIFRQYVERNEERLRGTVSPGAPVPPRLEPAERPRRPPFGPRELLFESRFRDAIWGGTLLASGVGVLAALWLGSRIVRPVVTLTQATRVIAGGGAPPLVPVAGRDEVAELGHAFNRMTTQLAAQIGRAHV